MKDNYCVMNVNGKIESNGSVWEMCVKSDDGDVIYPTNVFIEANNVCEAIEIAKDHIYIHKNLMDQCGCVTLDDGLLINKTNLL